MVSAGQLNPFRRRMRNATNFVAITYVRYLLCMNGSVSISMGRCSPLA
jgi:hypothetical protein